MAKKKNEAPKANELVFLCSGTLSDDTDFEKGDPVPADLSAAELESLQANGAISAEVE